MATSARKTHHNDANAGFNGVGHSSANGLANGQSNGAPPKDVVNIKEVAKKAGVSTATVSRVLSGRGYVSPELTRQVEDATNELNYHPNRTARNLRRRVAQIVGACIPDIENPFFTSVIRGIESTIAQEDFTLLLCDTYEDPRRETLFLNTLWAERVSGIILAPSGSESEALQRLVSSGMPVVVIDRILKKTHVDTVTVGNGQGAYDAIQHLVAGGYRRIAYIGGPERVSTGVERKRGYLQGLEAAGLAYDPGLCRVADFRHAGGYQAMSELLDLDPPPSVVLVGNNLMTLGALQAIHERSLAIPDGIAVVGFDDMVWASSLQPALTVVAQPTSKWAALPPSSSSIASPSQTAPCATSSWIRG